ncbi:ROK family protein [Streptomyces albicerus]|uniref:ROK family protein n=1 Tax=Streptomyces albicerus TaxID=2569859 RepID=UPI00124B8915|nr:ROK family protein [Streptomyces albicerus]
MSVGQDGVTGLSAGERINDAARLLDLVRTGRTTTRRELSRHSGLGRKALSTLVAALVDRRLLAEEGPGGSTASRTPRELRFGSGAGTLLVAQFGATGLSAGIADLDGRILRRHHEPHLISAGPEAALARLEELFERLLDGLTAQAPPVWGVGVGLPGPVEFRMGRPVAPPIMPGWDGYPVRDRLAARFRAPAWVDNDVNVLALGELHSGVARGEQDVVYVKIGTGIGAGLLTGGRLHRGARGAAGDVGHIGVRSEKPVVCRCGRYDCLEALAGGVALAREGAAAARDGSSLFLAARLDERGNIEARDVADAAHAGDPVAIALLTRSGQLVGEMLSTVVNFYNPTVIVLGGGVVAAGDLVLATVRRTLYERSLPLATRDLRILRSADGVNGLDIGLVGAARMVADELFSTPALARWLPVGSPAGRLELTDLT